MYRYTASDLITHATSLADLQNSSFITWGDNFRLVNAAYRKVYDDVINMGDLNYLQEVALITRGTSLFELPEDFYKLAMLTDDQGNEIPKLKLNSSLADYGYEIKNGTILLQNCRASVILKYYPIPETITYKAKRTADITTLLNATNAPLLGFNDNILVERGAIFNITKGTFSSTTLSLGSERQRILLGRDAIWYAGTVYYLDALQTSVDSISSAVLTTSGNIVEMSLSSDIINDIGWANDDLSEYYYLSGFTGTNGYTISYKDGTVVYRGTGTPQARVIYWNGKWALLTLDKIVYQDGSWESTDSQSATVLLKGDMNTGYGYLVRTQYARYAVEGWTPDTSIDYPNNILFDLTAYDLAIRYRMKQNSDANSLMNGYKDLLDTYNKSISNDDQNFVTIRNVNQRFSKWRFY